MPASSGPDGVARTTRQLESVSDSFVAFRSDRLIPPYSTALFRLIRSTLQLRRYTQEPHGSSAVSARINHAKSFQMKQIVP